MTSQIRRMSTSKSFKIALVQMSVGKNKNANLENAVKFIRKAADNGASLVVLPECFNCPYGTKYFREYSEPIGTGITSKTLSNIAKEKKIFLVGGSIPEIDNDKVYNAATVWNPEGELVAKHRKVHLFDISIPGGITFKESEVLSPGNSFSMFNNGICNIGLGICYDMRFPELAQIYRKKGCDMLIYPGAFNMTTGPLHWELLLRSRANDNQVFVAACSPAQDKTSDYIAWGHSTVVDPWANIMASTEFEETIVYADIDMNTLAKVRDQIPTGKQKRYDLYDVSAKL
uniref:omega-amidase n=1 Tax=Cacopsylla melanoneura TaxID=428564 RepID=A0A8D9B857_9HEMI